MPNFYLLINFCEYGPKNDPNFDWPKMNLSFSRSCEIMVKLEQNHLSANNHGEIRAKIELVMIRNLRQMARSRSTLVYFLLSVTNIISRTNTLAYCGILKLRIRSVL